MTLLQKRPALSVALLAALVLTLALLAYLQYEWSGQISEAEKARLHEGLEAAIEQFRQDFNREIREAASAVDIPPQPDVPIAWHDLAARYRDWVFEAARPEIVSEAYVWDSSANDQPFYRLDPDEGTAEPAEWPASLESIRAGLRDIAAGERRGPGAEMRAFFTWTYVGNSDVLVRALPRFETPAPGAPPEPPEIAGYAFIVLDRAVLETAILPSLAQRHFGGPQGFTYDVGVFAESGGEAIYLSDPALMRTAFTHPDAISALFWDRRDFGGRGGFPRGFGGPGGGGRPPGFGGPGDRSFGGRRPRPGELRGGPAGGGPPDGSPDPRRGFVETFRGRGAGLPVVLAAGESRGWTLAVKHRLGSLEEAVDSQRRRNLAVSFGVLLLLAGSMAMIMVSTQRAQRLAKLQMDFVAGVSHELRTPLAVIVSAGDNLAEGVVANPEQVKQYGSLVRDEGRRLAGMVEQTLSFAAGGSRFRQLSLQPVDVAEVVRKAVDRERSAAGKLGFTIEESLETGLPAVQADEQTLSQSLENLIRNAVKYSGQNRWIAVSARRGGDVARDVTITVEDHGPGIEPDDLPHIFDPFYRGKPALAAQIHGSGLGLSLTKEAVEAMGGSIAVRSSPGKGSTFTMRLPAINSVAEKE